GVVDFEIRDPVAGLNLAADEPREAPIAFDEVAVRARKIVLGVLRLRFLGRQPAPERALVRRDDVGDPALRFETADDRLGLLRENQLGDGVLLGIFRDEVADLLNGSVDARPKVFRHASSPSSALPLTGTGGALLVWIANFELVLESAE